MRVAMSQAKENETTRNYLAHAVFRVLTGDHQQPPVVAGLFGTTR